MLPSKVSQKLSRIVKENEAKTNITFNARQPTNKLKIHSFRHQFWLMCSFDFRIFLELWPKNAPAPPSDKKERNQEPKGATSCP